MSKKGRPMNRKTKQLLIFLAVLAVVGAGVALLLLLPQMLLPLLLLVQILILTL